MCCRNMKKCTMFLGEEGKPTSGHTARAHQLWSPTPTWRKIFAGFSQSSLRSAALNIHETHLRQGRVRLLPWAPMSEWGDGGFLDVSRSLWGKKRYNMVDVREDLMGRGDLTVWQRLTGSGVCFTSSVTTNRVIVWVVRPAAGSVGSRTSSDDGHPFTLWLLDSEDPHTQGISPD